MTGFEYLIAYLLGLAASSQVAALTTTIDAVVDWRRGKLKDESQKLSTIRDSRSLRDQLRSVGNRVAELKNSLGIERAEEPLFDLLAHAAFQDQLATWLELWELDEAREAKAIIQSKMAVALKDAGATSGQIERFENEYFDLVESVVFSDPILARWRHHLGLRALHDKVDELREVAAKQAGEYSEKDRKQALERYRELALSSCDIIDLAGLPEDDRQIAMQNFLLRQLYIPLRVKVEVAAGKQATVEQLEEIEKHREARRIEEAGRKEKSNGLQIESAPIGDRLKKSNRLIVLGDPGSGKTTLIRWLATAYLLRLKKDPDLSELPDVETLPDETWLPIVVRCRDLDEKSLSGSLDDVLSQTLRKAEMEPQQADVLRIVVRDLLANGKALLLIDGLDEVADPKLRAKFCRQVERVAVVFSNSPIVVTSRIVGYREMQFRMGQEFEHTTVADLTDQDKNEFARRWSALTEPEERRDRAAQDLTDAIHSSDRIERLTGNPMLLTTLALVKRKVGKLPNRRAELYSEAVQVLLNWRSEIDEPIDSREAIPQIEYVAYEMCRRGVQRLREDEILDLLESVRKDYPNIRPVHRNTPEDFLRLLERRTSIIIEAGSIDHDGMISPVFEFRHLTFQEYLAGRAIVDGRFPGHDRSRGLAERVAPLAGQIQRDDDSKLLKEPVVIENWREALRLCVACCGDDDVDDLLLAILMPQGSEDPDITARPRAILAASCLADEPNVSDEVAHEVLQAFVNVVSSGDGAGFRG